MFLRGDPEKDNKIITGQHIESSKEVKIGSIGIESLSYARYIVAVHASMFPEKPISIQEEDAESGLPREDERTDLDYTQRSIDEILASL